MLVLVAANVGRMRRRVTETFCFTDLHFNIPFLSLSAFPVGVSDVLCRIQGKETSSILFLMHGWKISLLHTRSILLPSDYRIGSKWPSVSTKSWQTKFFFFFSFSLFFNSEDGSDFIYRKLGPFFNLCSSRSAVHGMSRINIYTSVHGTWLKQKWIIWKNDKAKKEKGRAGDGHHRKWALTFFVSRIYISSLFRFAVFSSRYVRGSKGRECRLDGDFCFLCENVNQLVSSWQSFESCGTRSLFATRVSALITPFIELNANLYYSSRQKDTHARIDQRQTKRRNINAFPYEIRLIFGINIRAFVRARIMNLKVLF